MKVERLNENSIALIMDIDDLRTRDLKLNDLTYGSEKTKKLLEELSNLARRELNISVDTPMAVEAVPLKDGNIKLIITKVFEPDELDARFSRFTPVKGEMISLTIMKLLESTIDKFEDALKSGAPKKLSGPNDFNRLEIHSDKDIVGIFEFDEIDKASDAAKNVSHTDYDSIFYKDEKHKKFYLVLSIKNDLPKEELTEFNKTCNTLAEYGKRVEGHIGMNKAYYDEHYKVIIKEKAIKKLGQL